MLATIGRTETLVLMPSYMQRKTTQNMQAIFGDRWYGELQWNNVPEQHELNRYIIQMHQGLALVPSPADSRYYNETVWKVSVQSWLAWCGKPDYLSDELQLLLRRLVRAVP